MISSSCHACAASSRQVCLQFPPAYLVSLRILQWDFADSLTTIDANYTPSHFVVRDSRLLAGCSPVGCSPTAPPLMGQKRRSADQRDHFARARASRHGPKNAECLAASSGAAARACLSYRLPLASAMRACARQVFDTERVQKARAFGRALQTLWIGAFCGLEDTQLLF